MTTHGSATAREETPHVNQTTNNDPSSGNKIDLLVDLICRPGDEPETKSAALLVLMSTIERSTEPTAIANKVKHLVFPRCGELTFDDMVDAQIAAFEAELFPSDTRVF